ncbi:MAG: hypothetical protein F6K17_18310, partial [Okeania sp. SIO3C4]|nr:hypothetical protein [Okeania sp. SIO3C4]
MTEINKVIIYEFRSNFTYQSYGNSWRSTGFYGFPYAGITFDNGIIPKSLKTATGSQDSRFNVSQKIDYRSFINSLHQSRNSIGFKEFNDHFVSGNALVGRIIEEWAILAVVSVAIDFGNRPFPVKRYFCCKEFDDRNYDAMATLIEFFFDKRRESLTFEILENKHPQSYPVYGFSSQKLQSLGSLSSYYSKFDGLRLLKLGLDMSENNLLKIWNTSLSLVGGDRKKAAWAFNVDSVANPTDFTLIQAGSEEFFHRNFPTVSSKHLLPPVPSNHRELAKSNYSAQQTFYSSQSNEETTSSNFDPESVFSNFVENGKLSEEIFQFITTDIQQNCKQWEKLATKNEDEITAEFNSFSAIIRYYTLSALIVPERAIDLFQQLLFSRNDIWNVFLSSAKKLKVLIQPTENDSYFQNYIEEGVWLIINYIIEEKFELPQTKIFSLPRLRGFSAQQRFFTEEDNIWLKGIVLPLDKDFLMIKCGYHTQQGKNTSSSFKSFYSQLKTKEYRETYKQGYSNILKIASHPKLKSILIQTLKEEEQKDEISYKLYLSLKKSG